MNGDHMENSKFNETVESIISSIKKSGHDPYAQIYGYLTSGNDMYITRTGNARELIDRKIYRMLHVVIQ